MSDLKLFRTTPSGVAELAGGAMALEKSLQTLFEADLRGPARRALPRFGMRPIPTIGASIGVLGK